MLGHCLSCGKFHLYNPCVFRNSKCSKCGKIEHIQSDCIITVYFVASNARLCNSDSSDLNVPNESYCNQIHDIILPDMHCSHDSWISNEIIYRYVENMLS